MPIEIPPTQTTKPATEAFVADKLFVDDIHIRGNRETGNATVEITVTPYAETPDGPVFAATSRTLRTASAFGLAAIVPAVMVAIQRIYAAVGAWGQREEANRLTLAQATQAASDLIAEIKAKAEGDNATAATAVEVAAAMLQQVTATRSATFAAKEALNADDPERAAAEAAWEAADAAWKAATDAHADAVANAASVAELGKGAIAAVEAAQAARLAIAQAAVDDTANPPLA